MAPSSGVEGTTRVEKVRSMAAEAEVEGEETVMVDGGSKAQAGPPNAIGMSRAL